MATIRPITLKSGLVTYEIQVKATDKGSGQQVTRSMRWKPEAGMTRKKADKEALVIADKFEKEFLETLSAYVAGNEPNKLTFREMSERWLAKVKREESLSYYDKVESQLAYACTKIGGYKLKEINPDILQKFFDEIDERERRIVTITPLPTFRETIESYGFTYKVLRYEYKVQCATLAYALQGKNVSEKWAISFCKTTKIPFPKLFDVTEEFVPYAWETNNQIKRAVRCVLSLAKKNRLIVENYAKAEYISYPPKRKKRIHYMDDETSAKFVDYIMDKCNIKDKTILLTALLTGFRRGEIAGLEWRDIDFEHNTIAVNRSVVYLPKYGIFEKEPKTEGSIRVTAAPQILMDTLKEYKAYWEDLREKCGDFIKPSQKLFTRETGELINPCVLYQCLQRIIKKMGIGHYTLHSLRHTNISIQLAAGVPLVTVSVRAGHSRTSTTSDIYSHIINSSDKQAAETLNNLFSKKQNTEED